MPAACQVPDGLVDPDGEFMVTTYNATEREVEWGAEAVVGWKVWIHRDGSGYRDEV